MSSHKSTEGSSAFYILQYRSFRCSHAIRRATHSCDVYTICNRGLTSSYRKQPFLLQKCSMICCCLCILSSYATNTTLKPLQRHHLLVGIETDGAVICRMCHRLSPNHHSLYASRDVGWQRSQCCRFSPRLVQIFCVSENSLDPSPSLFRDASFCEQNFRDRGQLCVVALPENGRCY